MTGTAGFWIAAGSLAASSVFSSLHLALRTVVRTRVNELLDQRDDPACRRRVDRILADTEAHALAVSFPRIVLNLVVVVALVFWIAWIDHNPSDAALPPAPTLWHVAIALAAGSFLVWLVGFAIPSSIAEHAGERLIVSLSGLIRATYIALTPLAMVVRAVDALVRRVAGPRAESPAEAIEAELLSVVEQGQQGGQFDETERHMIEAVVDFRGTTVEQVMTPRKAIGAIEYTDDLTLVRSLVRDCPHSRIPVYDSNLDHVVGILYAKDLLRWLTAEKHDKPFELRPILRPAHFVPETMTLRELLTDLLAKKVHIAMVMDEFGGTAGLVTIEDIVEEIFGEIQDEFETPADAAEEAVINPAERAADLDARTRIADANDLLAELAIELPESEDYDTVGGYVTAALGRIPDAGERFDRHGLAITILDAEPARVLRVRFQPAPPQPENDTHDQSLQPHTAPAK